jgi:polar amino acid transport system substrate-binding protein
LQAPRRWSFPLALSLLFLSTVAEVAHAADPPLRWGGDKNGGAPFIFEDEAGKLTGFEVELADYLASELVRTPVFVQNQWDNLAELLNRPNLGRADDIDIVLNGYEFTRERHAETPTTVPYYVYTFRLIGRRDDSSVTSWAGIAGTDPKKRVGVLRGSASQKYLEARYGDAIELVPTETVTEQLDLVRDRRLDASVQDSPAAAYYVQEGRFPTLRVVDEPVGTGFYVILTRPGDDALRSKLNDAIRKAIRTGRLKALYQKYGLWDANQQRLAYLAEQSWPDVADEIIPQEGEVRPAVSIRFSAILGNLFRAAGMTLALAVASFPLAVLLGIVVALGRVYGPWPIRVLATAYVEVIRGTPLLLQLFVIFYLVPQLGVWSGSETLTALLSFPPFVAGVLGLAINYSAAEAENYRAGLQAIPRGQTEAGLALGMSPATVLRRIVLPQAIRVVIPPVTNDFIALFKDTAVCSTILIVELTGLYYQYKTYPGVVVELAAAIAALYLLMSYPLALLARQLERRMSPGARH